LERASRRSNRLGCEKSHKSKAGSLEADRCVAELGHRVLKPAAKLVSHARDHLVSAR
jgi:hypothetical protein